MTGDSEGMVKLADVLETIEFQCLRWEAGSPELKAANVILSAIRLRYGVPSPEEETP